MAIKSFSIRIDRELLDRLRQIATQEKRSINKQIIILIRDFVTRYEAVRGPTRP